MISVSGLTKDYGTRRAIDNLTFDARRGEILGFLGPNGAGKTTTMRILTGFMPPTSGTAEIGGFDVVDQSLEVRKLVGYLPETVPLYPDMTVFDYLKYMADLRHLENAEDHIDDVLDMVHMQDRADGYIEKLSKGMRQRIGLAQALLHEPDVLILDEPTIGLDPVQIIEVRNLIREIGKQKTVLLSTHILSEAQQLCDRVLIINKGRIVTEDSPQHLQTRLAGGNRVSLRVRGDASTLIPELAAVPGVQTINPDGQDMLSIETSPAMDPRPEVARLVIKRGLDLLEMHTASMSLEEIFLELTRDEQDAPQLDDAWIEAEPDDDAEEI
jgi:ABC-2 type transport system ATP-binding protein